MPSDIQVFPTGSGTYTIVIGGSSCTSIILTGCMLSQMRVHSDATLDFNTEVSFSDLTSQFTDTYGESVAIASGGTRYYFAGYGHNSTFSMRDGLVLGVFQK